MTKRLRYPELAPEGYAALSSFGHYVNAGTALEPVLLGMVYLRASVLNGCHFCIELHKKELQKHNEPDTRIDAAMRAPTSGAFTPREQAALRWTEVITHLGADPAPDAEYAAVERFFHGKDLVDLTFAIANINAWNRMGTAFRPEWRPRAPQPAMQSQDEQGAGEQAAALQQPAGQPSQAHAEAHEEAEDDGGKVATD